MFIWPLFMLRKYLKGRSTTFCFAFCVTFQPVLVNTVVLMLGLFHLLNPWVIRGLFYLPFLAEVIRWLSWGKKERRNLKHLLNGTYGLKMLCHNVLWGIGRRIRSFWRMIRARLYGHRWEYGLLAVIILYGMIYFSWGVFQTYSYGSGDHYVHNAWIYNLTKGRIFSAGVYPEGMHCFVYGMHVLFGIRIYSCMLFLQPVHVSVFLLSVYVFLKEVFRWRYTPMFVLAAFLTLNVRSVNAIVSMARLQWTLPQEFATHTVFLCAAFLVRYLHSAKRRSFRGKLTRGYWDENLLVFSLALATSLIVHFYPTIMAFFLCAALVPVHWKRIFSGKRFIPLVTAAVVGFTVAVIPMGGALASGIPFEGSMNWAMSIIRGSGKGDTAPQGGETGNQGSAGQPDGTGQDGSAGQTDGRGQGGNAGQADGAGQTGIQPDGSGGTGVPSGLQPEGEALPGMPETAVLPEPVKVSVKERLTAAARRLAGVLQEKGRILYQRSYVRVFGEERARLVLGVTLLAVLIWICYRIPAGFIKLILRKKEKKPKPEYFDQYFSVALASLIYMVLSCGAALGLPALIEDSRLCAMDQILALSVAGVSLDLIFTVLHLIVWDGLLKVVSAAVVVGIYALVVVSGNFHGFLFMYLTRLNSAVLVTHSITETMPPYSFTIISPTDDLYQQIQYGWHEELSGFVNQVQEKEYTLPSEHLFIYIEKRPFQYAQCLFATGPGWLAQDGYLESLGGANSSYASQVPDYTSSELLPAEEISGTKFAFDLSSNTYAVLRVRTLVESLAYQWCREFEKLYPGELQTYYEDENFVCYYIRQNPRSLYQLGLLYREVEE